MQRSEEYRFAAVCSVLVGVSYIVAGVTFFLLPEAQRPGSGFDEFMVSVAEGSTLSVVLY